MDINQIITQSGSISAGWVLVTVASICGILTLMIMNDIRSSIKSIITRQNAQEKEITKTTARVDYAHERIDEILQEIK